MSVVVIVADTFRRDHLGFYGNTQIHMPRLDRFSQQSTVFDRCYAASFPTMPVRADLSTGRFTFSHMGWEPLPKNEVTLAQVLSENRYHTFGVTDTPFFLRNGWTTPTLPGQCTPIS